MSGIAALRRFAGASREAAPDRCELCGATLAPRHGHLLERSRRLACACAACALLFPEQGGTRFRRVPPVCARLPELALPPGLWESLGVPIGVAFFVVGDGGEVRAHYPGPAGAIESGIEPGSWKRLVANNPGISDMAPEVEALLVNRLERASLAWRVSIDRCFELTGLLRAHWRGLAGGEAVRRELARFFAELDGAGACRT